MAWPLFIPAFLISFILLFLLVDGIRKIRNVPTAELVDSKETIPWDYFDFIGRQLPEALEYTNLVESGNYSKIYAHWPRFEKAFRNAEIAAGHKGRPLIMDYYLNYRRYLREYLRRAT